MASPAPLSPEAFLEAVGRAYAEGDAEAYAGLFAPPVAFFSDSATQLVHDRDGLRERLRLVRRRREDFGVVGHTARIVSTRPYAGHLTAVRVSLRLDLADGLSADEREELWILREVDGRQHLCLTANSAAVEMLEHGRPETPGSPSPARDLSQLVERVESTFNTRDAVGHAALFDAPLLAIDDVGTDALGLEVAHSSRMPDVFATLDPARISVLQLVPRAERPYGRNLAILRVGVTVIDGAGHRSDPHEELWLVREHDGALRIGAIVNTLNTRFLETPPQPRSPR